MDYGKYRIELCQREGYKMAESLERAEKSDQEEDYDQNENGNNK